MITCWEMLQVGDDNMVASSPPPKVLCAQKDTSPVQYGYPTNQSKLISWSIAGGSQSDILQACDCRTQNFQPASPLHLWYTRFGNSPGETTKKKTNLSTSYWVMLTLATILRLMGCSFLYLLWRKWLLLMDKWSLYVRLVQPEKWS